MVLDPFVELDATGQAALVRSGEASALELVEAAIARIEALDGDLNAVIWRGFDQARAAAAGRRPGADAPFAGVPYLVKDLAALAGAPLAYGSRLFAENRSRDSEPSVAAALAAGFIALGKTNTPEFGLLPSTEPLLFGATRNPWDPGRSAGGSSGGAAAAVAAGLVPLAGGGDGGGSLRIPASCCGLVGFKPTHARIIPLRRRPPGDYAAHLCLSRSVRDTAAYFHLSQRRGLDADLPPIPPVTGPSPRRLRIALGRRTVLGTEPEPMIAAALAEAAELCRDLGHEVVEAEPSIDRDQAVTRFLALWSAGPAAIERFLPLLRLRLWRWAPADALLEPWTRGLAAWMRDLRRRERDPVGASIAFFQGVARDYAAFFNAYDVALTPVLRSPPAPIGAHAPDLPFETLLERVVDYVGYTPVYNAIGAPAISLPLSMGADGLPIGAHLAAGAGQDARLLALAYELEAARPWAQRWPPLSAVVKSRM